MEVSVRVSTDEQSELLKVLDMVLTKIFTFTKGLCPISRGVPV